MTPTTPITRRTLPLLLLVLLGAGLALAHPDRAAAQGAPTPVPTPAVEEGAPVVVNGETLFRVNEPADFASTTARAAAIADSIERLANNPFVNLPPLTVIDTDEGTEVTAGDIVLFTVTDEDAAADGRSRLVLAQDAATAVQVAIDAGQADNDTSALLGRVGLLLLATLIFALLVWLVNRIYRWLYRRLLPDSPRTWAPNRITSTEFYRSGGLARMLKAIMRILRALTVGVLLFFYLPFVFRIFPLTERWGDRIYSTIGVTFGLMWDGIFEFLPVLTFIITVALIAYLIIHAIGIFFREVSYGSIRLPHFDPEWSRMTAALLSFVVGAIALIVIVGSLPIGESRALAGVLGFTGLLITLSSSSAIANIIAGIVLTYTNAIHSGDIISVGETRGEVMNKSLLTTRVRTFRNEIVTLPNTMVLSGSITNFSRLAESSQLVIHTDVTIGYDVPWPKVHELLLAAAAATDDVLETPAPYVLQNSLGDFSVAYTLNVFTLYPQYMPRTLSNLNRAILDQFNAAGVEILSPEYAAMRDGNKLTLPEEFLPEGYIAPPMERMD
jgi:small-conductance mechanosensitive channel